VDNCIEIDIQAEHLKRQKVADDREDQLAAERRQQEEQAR